MKGFSLKHANKSGEAGRPARRSAFGGDSDDEGSTGREEIRAFDTKGAVVEGRKPPEKKPDLVIESLANRDWKTEIYNRKQGIFVPNQKVPSETRDEDKPMEYGLNLPKHTAESAESAEANSSSHLRDERESIDEEEVLPGGVSEEQAYRYDIDSRPDAPSMAAYDRIPVEEFGAALLRGMGWKGPSKDEEPDPASDTRRPAFLGLGAKAIESGVDELGAWGKSATKRSAKIERTYIPVVMVNKATGEKVEEKDEDGNGSNISSRRSREPEASDRTHRDERVERRDRDDRRSDRHRDSRDSHYRDRREDHYTDRRDREDYRRDDRHRRDDRDRRDRYGDRYDRRDRTDRDRRDDRYRDTRARSP